MAWFVSKECKYKNNNEEQLLNILLKSLTFAVLKWDKFKDFKEKHL